MVPSPGTTTREPRCVVVGAGVLGVLTSLRMLERGVRVTLLDSALPGSGTSGSTFAHVNASYAGYWDYVELRAAGVAGYRRLRAELGSAPWLRDTGFLAYDRSPEVRRELDAQADRMRDLGYPVARLTPSFVRDRLEPDLSLDDAVEEVFLYPDEGYVDVRSMLADVLRRAVGLGLSLRPRQRVVGIDVSERGRVVRLESGEQLAADFVVCCCGRWTDEVLQGAGVDLRLVAPDGPGSKAPGLLVVTSPVTASLGRLVCADGLNLRPDGGGRVMLWSGELDGVLQAHGAEAMSEQPHPMVSALADEVLDRGRVHLPALADASIERAQVALRALPADGLPVLGWVANGLYTVLAHAGVTLAPVLAEIAVAEIVDGRADPRAERFRPDRLSADRMPAPAGSATSGEEAWV
jgi:D-hydroxyproline dehydrogenase subunit beta